MTEKPTSTTTPPTSAEIPPQPRAATTSDAPDDVTPSSTKPAEQLGFQMRFEAGRALLALDNRVAEKGIEVRRALFEVPDVAFPLDVSGGALRFQNKRLTLRAVELALTWDGLFVVDALRRAGLQLIRERSRAGGLELVVEVQGPTGGVPVRARAVFAPVGEAGIAVVLHEVIGFGSLPRSPLELAPALLDALALPGGLPARAMLRRAEPFRAVFGRLLPAYGWKVPALGDVRVHETVLGKGEVVLRAWSGKAPDGWKPPREQKRGPLEEAIALAVFADGLADAVDDDAKRRLIDRLIDEGGLARAAVPFAAELLRRDPRRRADGDDLVARALKDDDEHLGLLAAHVDAAEVTPLERATRLLRLSEVADADDEPWVAARAALAAASLAQGAGDLAVAVKAAEAAVEADPSVAEAGILLSRLLQQSGEAARALVVGRAALDRAGAGSIVEPEAQLLAADRFAAELAKVAKNVEGVDAARTLYRRALRTRELPEALVPLVELEIDAGNYERAAEGITRLLALVDNDRSFGKDVELLAARLAEAKGDKSAARGHLMRARALSREAGADDARVALRLARLFDEADDKDGALAALQDVIADDVDATHADVADVCAALFYAARLLVQRARGQQKRADAERARVLLARLRTLRGAHDDKAAERVDADARAFLGDPAPLARLLLADAEAAQDTRAATAARLEAARLFIAAGDEAGAVDDAARALAAAFAKDPSAVGDLMIEHAGAPGLAAALGAALRAVESNVDVDAASAEGARDRAFALARRIGATGRPSEARAFLQGRDDTESRELRATFAKDAADVDAEIGERAALLERTTGFARQTQRVRLAVLFERAGRHHDAADAWAEGASADDGAYDSGVDVAAWLRAALATDDGARIARVVVRDDVDLRQVASAPLRAAIDNVDDAAASRRLLAALAARNDDIKDVERWLAAAGALPPEEAALAFIDAGRRAHRADWLKDGAARLRDAGRPAAALGALNDAINDAAGAAVAADVVEFAFDLACDLDDAHSIEARARGLFDTSGIDEATRRRVHQRRADAHANGGRSDDADTAVGAWLDEFPADIEALTRLVTRATGARAPLDGVVDRLDRARAAGVGDDAEALVRAIADAAEDRSDAAEIRGRELLLGFALLPDARERVQRRLVDLNIAASRSARAVHLLHELVAQRAEASDANDDAEASAHAAADLAALWLRIADLEEHETKDIAAATAALEARLRYAPDDADSSRRLLGLLLDINDDDALARECLRRASRLSPSQERNDLYLRAADVARRQGRVADARRTYLRALAAKPFSAEALARIIELARETSSRRLAIRGRLRAARLVAADHPVDATRHAAEAGGLLAGVLHRTRLAIAAFAFAERVAVERGVDDDGAHSRMLVELFRALGDGKNARLRLDHLIDRAEGRDRARLLESRADVAANLLGDTAAAIADRRAALALEPSFSSAARALVRLLRQEGDVRGAIDVERAHADAASTGEARGLTYARLAAVAEDEVKDAALVEELAVAALALRDDVEVWRRLIAAREQLVATDPSAAPRLIMGLRGLLERPLDADERLARALRAADLLEANEQRPDAVFVLQAALNDDAVAAKDANDTAKDEATARLARLCALTGRLREAAAIVLKALDVRPDGTPALGTRTSALEQAAAWLDDASDDDNDDAADYVDVDGAAAAAAASTTAARAFDALERAAAAGTLSDDGEGRRARLAEELGHADVAVTALESLISRSIEVSENARRLAVAAERAGDLKKALASWRRRLQLDAGRHRRVARLRATRPRCRQRAGPARRE